MIKEYQSITDLVKDPVFVQKVKSVLSDVITQRHKRPEPKPGFHYVRDWYDRMMPEGQLTADFFLKEIELVWHKKSNLSSEKRKVIQHVADIAFAQTDQYYKNLPEQNMSKEEAVKAMKEGKKVTHVHFSPDEWMTIEGTEMVLEDNVRVSEAEFWSLRKDQSWNEGYSIWISKKQNEKVPAEHQS